MRLKYRAGDEVVALRSYGDQFTKGKVYTVREDLPADHAEHASLTVMQDDLGARTNGWNQKYFEKVKPEVFYYFNSRFVLWGPYASEDDARKHAEQNDRPEVKDSPSITIVKVVDNGKLASSRTWEKA